MYARVRGLEFRARAGCGLGGRRACACTLIHTAHASGMALSTRAVEYSGGADPEAERPRRLARHGPSPLRRFHTFCRCANERRCANNNNNYKPASDENAPLLTMDV